MVLPETSRQYIPDLSIRWGVDIKRIIELGRDGKIPLWFYFSNVIFEPIDRKKSEFVPHLELRISTNELALTSKKCDLSSYDVQDVYGYTKERGEGLVKHIDFISPQKRRHLTIELSKIYARLNDVIAFEEKHNALQQNKPVSANQIKADLEDKLNPSERKSLLKLVYVMAVKGYYYNADDKKSIIPKQIEEDAAGLDIKLTDDTVRKWLKEGARLKKDDF